VTSSWSLIHQQEEIYVLSAMVLHSSVVKSG